MDGRTDNGLAETKMRESRGGREKSQVRMTDRPTDFGRIEKEIEDGGGKLRGHLKFESRMRFSVVEKRDPATSILKVTRPLALAHNHGGACGVSQQGGVRPFVKIQ